MILRKTLSIFCIVKKQLTLYVKRFSGYRWHKNISSFIYLIYCWITTDCNKFNHVLFILKFQPNWETAKLTECQLRKRDGSWIFVVPKLGVSDFENRINYQTYQTLLLIYIHIYIHIYIYIYIYNVYIVWVYICYVLHIHIYKYIIHQGV